MHQPGQEKIGPRLGPAQRLTTLAICLVFVVSVVYALAIAAGPKLAETINHDVASLSYVSVWLAEGGDIYTDVFEQNAPSLFYFYLPPAIAYKLWGGSHVHFVHAYIAFWLFIAGLLTWIVLRLTPGGRSWVTRIALLGAFAAVCIIHPAYDFGQRSNLMAALTFPYLLLAGAFTQGVKPNRWLAIVTGIVAVVGFALKPYFVLIWLAVELVVIISTRNWRSFLRPQNITVIASFAVVGILMLILEPDYLNSVHVALAVYRVWDAPLKNLVHYSKPTLILGAAVLPLLILIPARERRIVLLLVTSSLVCLVIAVMQGKGFRYQFLGAEIQMFLALTWTLLRVASTQLQRWPKLEWLSVGILLVALALPAHAKKLNRRMPRYLPTDLLEIVKREAANEPIYLISTEIVPAFPLVNRSGAKWRVRFLHLMPLPAYYGPRAIHEPPAAGYRTPAEMDQIEREMFDAVVSDIVKTPPKLLINDMKRYRHGLGRSSFDFIEYLSQDDRFDALMQKYAEVATIRGFIVYRRKD